MMAGSTGKVVVVVRRGCILDVLGIKSTVFTNGLDLGC